MLVYSTFLGGASLAAQNPAQDGLPYPTNGANGFAPFYQGATAISVDPSGNLYVVGATSADDFPTTSGVVQPVNTNNDFVGFLSKIDPSGRLVFSTYLDGMTAAAAIAIDASSGNIYVAGINTSAPQPPLPIPAGTTPFGPTPKPISIVELNSNATSILNATYLGGSSVDLVTGLALDSNSNVYLAGTTSSNDFPTMNPLQPSLGASGKNVFVTKMNSTLSSLVYSTYLGLDSYAQGAAASQTPTTTASHGIAVDSSGDAYVVGFAGAGFPVTSGAIVSTCSGGCFFMTELNPAGTSLLYSTLLLSSGAPSDFVSAVAVDASKNVFLAGGGADPTFQEVNPIEPCPAPAMLQGQRIDNSGFIVEINAAHALALSTCFGEYFNALDLPNFGVDDLTLDSSGNLYVVGYGNPTMVNPIQANSSAGALYVAAIHPQTPSVLFASYLAGVNVGTPPNGTATGVGVDSNGNIYAAGFIYGTFNSVQPPLPVFNALQPVAGLEASVPPACGTVQCVASDAFVLKIAPTDAAAAALYPALVTFPVQPIGTPSDPLPVTVIDMGSAALTVSNATATGPFSLQNNCATVAAAGGTCAIQVTFTPTAAGTQTGVLTITDSSAGSPRTVQLTGQGGQGSVAFSPSSLSFGNQALSVTSPPQTLTLTNTGALSLEISHIQASSPFEETNNCGTSLAANASCTVSVTFTPTANGAATGTVMIIDSAPDSPQTVALTGTGGGSSSGGGTGGGGGTGAPPSIGIGIPSGGSATATVTAGATATYALAIGGAGLSGTASLTCTGAPTGATCSVPNSIPLNATTPSSFNVTVTTTAASQTFPFRFDPTLFLCALALLGCLALARAATTLRSARPWSLAPMLALTLCACGGGNSSSNSTTSNGNSTSTGNYTIIVTAKSGSTTQTQNLTLIVK